MSEKPFVYSSETDSDSDERDPRFYETFPDRSRLYWGLVAMVIFGLIMLCLTMISINIFGDAWIVKRYLSKDHTDEKCDQFSGLIKNIVMNTTGGLYEIDFDVYRDHYLVAKNKYDQVEEQLVQGEDLIHKWRSNVSIPVFGRCKVSGSTYDYKLTPGYAEVDGYTRVSFIIVILLGWIFSFVYLVVGMLTMMTPLIIWFFVKRIRGYYPYNYVNALSIN